MQFILIDSAAETRALLIGRVNEAMKQAEITKLDPLDLEVSRIETFEWAAAVGCLIGPGCHADLDEVCERVRMMFPSGHIAVVLENNVYAAEAVTLRKRLNVNVLALGDVAQIAGFLLDCEARLGGDKRAASGKAVIGIAQLKGGVGVTSLTAAFASCWARHGLTVAAIDFDDVNPQLTAWARVGLIQRTVTSELLRAGEVPPARVNEIVNPVEGFEGRLVVVGQPEGYNESFQYKANVIDGAPSASEFVNSLISALSAEFQIVIVDMGRSWGVASFALLPLCQHLVLVTDDDGMSVRRTLDCFDRLKKESDDPEEFNLDRWSLVLNAFTGKLISPKEIAAEIQDMDLLSAHSSLFTIPFSEQGRQWGAPGESPYDAADEKTRQVIRRVACNLVPFRYEPDETLGTKLLKRVGALVGH